MAIKKIAIFGATGRTGLTTLAQAVQAGMSWSGREMSRGVQSTRKGHRGVGPRLVGTVSALVCEDPRAKAGGHGSRSGGRYEIQFYVSSRNTNWPWEARGLQCS